MTTILLLWLPAVTWRLPAQNIFDAAGATVSSAADATVCKVQF